MSVRIAGNHHHPGGDHKTPKFYRYQTESIYKNRKGLAWTMLTLIVAGILAMIYLSVVPDDNTDQDQTEQVENQ